MLKGQLAADIAALPQLKEKQKLIEEQLQSFDAQQPDLKSREETLIDANAKVLAQQGASETWAKTRSQAETDYRATNDALTLSQQEDLRARLLRTVADSTSRERHGKTWGPILFCSTELLRDEQIVCGDGRGAV